MNDMLVGTRPTHGVAVHGAPEGFDARFSATSRRYRYTICDDPAQVDPLRVRETVVHRRSLDVSAMSADDRVSTPSHFRVHACCAYHPTPARSPLSPTIN